MSQFTPGNQLWKKRAKHGRDVIFFDPDFLWEAACEYFEYCDGRTWNTADWVGKDAQKVTREHFTPYSISGLCAFLGVNKAYLSEFEESKAYASQPEFSEVIARIRAIIETHQLEGAMTGHFDGRIVSQLLGLIAKKDVTSGGNTLAPRVEVVSQQAADDLNKLDTL